ncbi:hypothetical protein ACQ4M3_32355 [Leptolyngbya sp. AN03gr2]
MDEFSGVVEVSGAETGYNSGVVGVAIVGEAVGSVGVAFIGFLID